jgi:hypothetical protein
VAPAPRRRRARPGRPVHRGRPAPARLRQPGLPDQPRDQRARPEPAAVPELPDHPGDPGLGRAAARHEPGDRPGRRGGLADRLPVAHARAAPAAKADRLTGRGIHSSSRTDWPGPPLWYAKHARRCGSRASRRSR